MKTKQDKDFFLSMKRLKEWKMVTKYFKKKKEIQVK